MNNFTVGNFVVDNDELCAPRKIVMYFCEHCKKEIMGMLGTTDGVIIPITNYNEGLYKAHENNCRENENITSHIKKEMV